MRRLLRRGYAAFRAAGLSAPPARAGLSAAAGRHKRRGLCHARPVCRRWRSAGAAGSRPAARACGLFAGNYAPACARIYGHRRVAFPKRPGFFPVGAAGNRAAVRRFVSRRVGQRRVAAAADSRAAAQQPRARRSGAAHCAAVRRRAGCHRAAHATVFADRAGAGDAGSARPADDRRLPVFHAGTHHVFAEHDRLSAARRFSTGRPGQSGGYPGDAGAHVGADASARLDQKRIQRPLLVGFNAEQAISVRQSAFLRAAPQSL